jgi:hypothetical protein
LDKKKELQHPSGVSQLFKLKMLRARLAHSIYFTFVFLCQITKETPWRPDMDNIRNNNKPDWLSCNVSWNWV